MNTDAIEIMRWLKWGLTVCLVFFMLLVPAHADPFSDWNISGYNTIRGEYYDVDGDRNASPWPYTGGQFYNELDLYLHRRVSAWESLRFNLSGLVNASDYRSDENGGILERGGLFWEKGDSTLPFRLQLGDFYATQSPRTLQLGLKGFQFEVQPSTGQSIQLFSGLVAPVYRDLDTDLATYTGGSWLIESPTLGALSLTGVYHHRGDNAIQNDLSQTITSLAWYKPFKMGVQDLEIDTELAFFSGEYDDGGSLVDSEDKGYSVQLGSRAQQLTYRFIFEQYGEDFHPAGGALTPDHRAIEGHAGWIFLSGMQLRGRIQSFRDNLESDNPLDTDVAGLSLSGPLWASSSLHVGVDGFVQQREDRINTLKTDTRSVSINFNKQIIPNLSARGGFIWTDTDDHLADFGSISRQLNISIDASVSAWGWRSTFSPGLTLRDVSGRSESSQLNPMMAVHLSKGGHTLLCSHNWISQDGRSNMAMDTDLHQTALAYNFRKGQHRLNFEVNRFDRDPDGGSDTEAYRISAYWTYSFGRPAKIASTTPVANLDISDSVTLPDFLELVPSMSLDSVKLRLSRNQKRPVYRLPGLEVYELKLLDIDLYQRLGLSHEKGRLKKASLIINFVDTGDIKGLARDYARVRDLLLKRYGSPENFQEEGSFNTRLAVDQAMGKFERILEWETKSGHMRFGIPQRLDGNLRMEMVYAGEIPPGRYWGVEALR